MTAAINRREHQHERDLSVKHQWDFIQRLMDQVDFFNNADVGPDFILYLKIAKRRLEP